jgi:hypothetical protein
MKLLSPENIQSTGRFAGTLNCLEPVVVQISDAARHMGVSDPNRIHRANRIGEWTGQDFATGATRQKKWEIDKTLLLPGGYQVAFHRHGNGSNAQIKWVALSAAPAADPARQTEICRVAREETTETHPAYNLSLQHHDPQQRYFLVVELDGGGESARCIGNATIRKLKN